MVVSVFDWRAVAAMKTDGRSRSHLIHRLKSLHCTSKVGIAVAVCDGLGGSVLACFAIRHLCS